MSPTAATATLVTGKVNSVEEDICHRILLGRVDKSCYLSKMIGGKWKIQFGSDGRDQLYVEDI